MNTFNIIHLLLALQGCFLTSLSFQDLGIQDHCLTGCLQGLFLQSLNRSLQAPCIGLQADNSLALLFLFLLVLLLPVTSLDELQQLVDVPFVFLKGIFGDTWLSGFRPEPAKMARLTTMIKIISNLSEDTISQFHTIPVSQVFPKYSTSWKPPWWMRMRSVTSQ